MAFWKDGLSIDESKASMLMVGFLITLVFSLVMYYLRGDITNNLQTIIITLASLIGGYNIIHDISEYWKNKSN